MLGGLGIAISFLGAFYYYGARGWAATAAAQNTLEWYGGDPVWNEIQFDARLFSAVMFADNLGVGFAVIAIVTYMSTLTSVGYTATQYALLSSTYTYIGKFAKGFSGVMVEHFAAGRTLLDGYALFFITCGLLGVPALVLCLVLARATQRARNPAAI